MIVLDSSVWLEYFVDGPQALVFAPVILSPERLLVPSVSLYEVYKRVCQLRHEGVALQVVAQMQRSEVVALDAAIALHAAELSRLHRLPMADSMILATAQARGAELWTQDADFETVPGVRYFPKLAVHN